MKNNKKIIRILILLILCIFSAAPVFAESTTAEPYTKEEFPQSLNDLRRFEIITLGSMPFVMLDVSIGYSAYKSIFQGADFNLFNTSSYTLDETMNIIYTSLAVSASIGLTDFIINLIKRNYKKSKINNSSYINIIPIEEDMDAVKIEPPQTTNEINEETE